MSTIVPPGSPTQVQPEPYYSDDLVTLYHGDCREVTAWLEADVLVTDPPYGIAYMSGWPGAFHGDGIAYDESLRVRDDALALWRARGAVAAEKPSLVFGSWRMQKPSGTRAVLTWEKGEHVGMGDLSLPWKPNTEEIYVLGGGFVGPRTSSVLKCHAIAGTVGRAQDGTRSHPTEKPVALMGALIRKTAGMVADPFAGSGTTLVAAKNEGRRAIGIELEERYCEIAAKRLTQDTLFGGVA